MERNDTENAIRKLQNKTDELFLRVTLLTVFVIVLCGIGLVIVFGDK